MPQEIKIKGIVLHEAASGDRSPTSILPSRNVEYLLRRLVGHFILKVDAKFPDKGWVPQRQRLHVVHALGYM